MKKLCFLLSLIIVFSIFGCNVPSSGEYYTFVDDLGKTVKLTQKPQKVAVLFSSYVEIWTLSGGNTAITVGESVERGLVDENALIVDNGAGKTINTELLLSYKPDFVIASADIDGQVECSTLLGLANVPVAYFRVDTFSDYLNVLDICTSITGERENYQEKGVKVGEKIQEILVNAKKSEKKILFIRAGSKIAKTKISGEHFACDALKELGMINIAESAPILHGELSVEKIIEENPDYIFVSTMGEESSAISNMESKFSSPPYQALTAVKEKKYYYLPKELFQYKPNHRWAECYEYLVEIIYGE